MHFLSTCTFTMFQCLQASYVPIQFNNNLIVSKAKLYFSNVADLNTYKPNTQCHHHQ